MQVYENCTTGEIVYGEMYSRELHFAHKKAVEWFRNGDNVNIYKSGRNLSNTIKIGSWEV